MWWHIATHGWGSEGGTCEWSEYPIPFTLPRNMVYPTLLPMMCTSQLPVVDWTDAHSDLNGLVRFAERRNLVSARITLHFNWPLPTATSNCSVVLYWPNCRDKLYTLLFKGAIPLCIINIYEGESKSKCKIHLTALIEVTVSNFTYHFST